VARIPSAAPTPTIVQQAGVRRREDQQRTALVLNRIMEDAGDLPFKERVHAAIQLIDHHAFPCFRMSSIGPASENSFGVPCGSSAYSNFADASPARCSTAGIMASRLLPQAGLATREGTGRVVVLIGLGTIGSLQPTLCLGTLLDVEPFASSLVGLKPC
jgi:hypothetical protein